MQPGFSKLFKLVAALAGILAVAGAGQARSASAYLVVSGPSPLRYEAAETNVNQFPAIPSVLVSAPVPTPVVVPEAKPETKAQANAPAADVVVPPPVEISPPGAATTNGAAMTMLPESPATPATDNTNVELVPGYKHTASEMLVMTPQMLNDYFKPAAGKNGTDKDRVSVVVPMAVDFTPPTPRTAPASSATYKTP